MRGGTSKEAMPTAAATCTQALAIIGQLYRIERAASESHLDTAVRQRLRQEQALRPIVLGRRNWLFAGSETAAHRTAILCSLVQTCKHLQLDPFAHLRDIIERVSTHPARLVPELTPREWRRLRQAQAPQAAA